MSEERKPPLQFNLDAAPALAMRDFAAHMVQHTKNRSPITFIPLNPTGNVDIPIPEAWHNNQEKVPRWINHLKDPASTRLPRALCTGDNHAAVFWLDPHLLDATGKLPAPHIRGMRHDIESQVIAAVEVMERELYFPDIEYRIFLPDANLQEKLGDRACAAIILATAPQFYEHFHDELLRITSEMKMRHAFEHAADEKGGDYDHSRNWERRFRIDKSVEQKAALDAIIAFACRPPEIIKLDNDAFLCTTIPHLGNSPIASQRFIDVDSTDLCPFHNPTHALVLWLHPDYRVPPEHAFHGSEISAAEELPMDELKGFEEALRNRLTRAVHCRMEYPGQLEDTHIPCALIIYADETDQRATLEKTKRALDQLLEHQRSGNAPSRG